MKSHKQSQASARDHVDDIGIILQEYTLMIKSIAGRKFRDFTSFFVNRERQIKNIKLPIVTDIKLRMYNEGST